MPRLRDEYDRRKFVGREETIAIAEQWRQENKRLLTITGIPGIGKTWLINHLVQLWVDEPATLIKYLDLQPYIDDQQKNAPQEPFEKSPQFFDAARQFIEQCDVGVIYDSRIELAVQMEQVAERLCEKYRQGYLIYLFLDGADDISEEEWDVIEKQLVEPLCRCEEIRFVISLRDSHKIQSFPLRQQEERLSLTPLVEEEGRIQLRLRGVADTEIDGLTAKGYALNHPCINHFLFTVLQEQATFAVVQINTEFVRELLLALDTVRIQNAEDLSHAITLLLNLVYLSDQWSFQEYRTQRNLSINDAWEEIDFLQLHYLILFVPGSAQLYCVSPGILPFLRLVQGNTLTGGENNHDD